LSVRIGWERHGSGAPLLLIHGLGYARWGWEPVLPRLAERLDVILFDNRGIGESDSPPGPYTAREMAEDAVQVLDEAGVERAHVVGTSLGGMVAQELALAPKTVAARPEFVDRIMTHRLATAQSPVAWAAQAAAGMTFDAYDRLGGLRAPTLVQHGGEDAVVDPRNGDLLAELVPAARLDPFPGTGHLFFWEEPERFVTSLTAFLEATA
jgi:pimeloyl-ACP methyl ester carboxylesterase